MSKGESPVQSEGKREMNNNKAVVDDPNMLPETGAMPTNGKRGDKAQMVAQPQMASQLMFDIIQAAKLKRKDSWTMVSERTKMDGIMLATAAQESLEVEMETSAAMDSPTTKQLLKGMEDDGTELLFDEMDLAATEVELTAIQGTELDGISAEGPEAASTPIMQSNNMEAMDPSPGLEHLMEAEMESPATTERAFQAELMSMDSVVSTTESVADQVVELAEMDMRLETEPLSHYLEESMPFTVVQSGKQKRRTSKGNRTPPTSPKSANKPRTASLASLQYKDGYLVQPKEVAVAVHKMIMGTTETTKPEKRTRGLGWINALKKGMEATAAPSLTLTDSLVYGTAVPATTTTTILPTPWAPIDPAPLLSDTWTSGESTSGETATTVVTTVTAAVTASSTPANKRQQQSKGEKKERTPLMQQPTKVTTIATLKTPCKQSSDEEESVGSDQFQTPTDGVAWNKGSSNSTPTTIIDNSRGSSAMGHEGITVPPLTQRSQSTDTTMMDTMSDDETQMEGEWSETKDIYRPQSSETVGTAAEGSDAVTLSTTTEKTVLNGQLEMEGTNAESTIKGYVIQPKTRGHLRTEGKSVLTADASATDTDSDDERALKRCEEMINRYDGPGLTEPSTDGVAMAVVKGRERVLTEKAQLEKDGRLARELRRQQLQPSSVHKPASQPEHQTIMMKEAARYRTTQGDVGAESQQQQYNDLWENADSLSDAEGVVMTTRSNYNSDSDEQQPASDYMRGAALQHNSQHGEIGQQAEQQTRKAPRANSTSSTMPTANDDTATTTATTSTTCIAEATGALNKGDRHISELAGTRTTATKSSSSSSTAKTSATRASATTSSAAARAKQSSSSSSSQRPRTGRLGNNNNGSDDDEEKKPPRKVTEPTDGLAPRKRIAKKTIVRSESDTETEQSSSMDTVISEGGAAEVKEQSDNIREVRRLYPRMPYDISPWSESGPTPFVIWGTGGPVNARDMDPARINQLLTLSAGRRSAKNRAATEAGEQFIREFVAEQKDIMLNRPNEILGRIDLPIPEQADKDELAMNVEGGAQAVTDFYNRQTERYAALTVEAEAQDNVMLQQGRMTEQQWIDRQQRRQHSHLHQQHIIFWYNMVLAKTKQFIPDTPPHQLVDEINPLAILWMLRRLQDMKMRVRRFREIIVEEVQPFSITTTETGEEQVNGADHQYNVPLAVLNAKHGKMTEAVIYKHTPFADEDNDVTEYMEDMAARALDGDMTMVNEGQPDIMGESQGNNNGVSDGDNTGDSGNDSADDEVDGRPMSERELTQHCISTTMASTVTKDIVMEVVEEPRLNVNSLAQVAKSSLQKAAPAQDDHPLHRTKGHNGGTASKSNASVRSEEWVLNKREKVIKKELRKGDRKSMSDSASKADTMASNVKSQHSGKSKAETLISQSGKVYEYPQYAPSTVEETHIVMAHTGNTYNRFSGTAREGNNERDSRGFSGGDTSTSPGDRPVTTRYYQRRDDYRPSHEQPTVPFQRRDRSADRWDNRPRNSRSPPRVRRDSGEYRDRRHDDPYYSSDSYNRDQRRGHPEHYHQQRAPLDYAGYNPTQMYHMDGGRAAWGSSDYGERDGYYHRVGEGHYPYDPHRYPTATHDYRDRGRTTYRDEYNYRGASGSSRDAYDHSRERVDTRRESHPPSYNRQEGQGRVGVQQASDRHRHSMAPATQQPQLQSQSRSQTAMEVVEEVNAPQAQVSPRAQNTVQPAAAHLLQSSRAQTQPPSHQSVRDTAQLTTAQSLHQSIPISWALTYTGTATTTTRTATTTQPLTSNNKRPSEMSVNTTQQLDKRQKGPLDTAGSTSSSNSCNIPSGGGEPIITELKSIPRPVARTSKITVAPAVGNINEDRQSITATVREVITIDSDNNEGTADTSQQRGWQMESPAEQGMTAMTAGQIGTQMGTRPEHTARMASSAQPVTEVDATLKELEEEYEAEEAACEAQEAALQHRRAQLQKEKEEKRAALVQLRTTKQQNTVESSLTESDNRGTTSTAGSDDGMLGQGQGVTATAAITSSSSTQPPALADNVNTSQPTQPTNEYRTLPMRQRPPLGLPPGRNLDSLPPQREDCTESQHKWLTDDRVERYTAERLIQEGTALMGDESSMSTTSTLEKVPAEEYWAKFRHRLREKGWKPTRAERQQSPENIATLIPDDEMEWETIRVNHGRWVDGMGAVVTEWELVHECEFYRSTETNRTRNCYVRRPQFYKYKNRIDRARLRRWEETDMQDVLDEHRNNDEDEDDDNSGGFFATLYANAHQRFNTNSTATSSSTNQQANQSSNKGQQQSSSSSSNQRSRNAYNEDDKENQRMHWEPAENDNHETLLEKSLQRLNWAKKSGNDLDIDIAFEQRMLLSHPAHGGPREPRKYMSDMETVVHIGADRGCARHAVGQLDAMMPEGQSIKTGVTIYFNTVEQQYMFGNGIRITKELFDQLMTICTKTGEGDNERYVYDLSKVRTEQDEALAHDYFRENSFTYASGWSIIDDQFRETLYSPAFEQLMGRPVPTGETITHSTAETWDKFLRRNDHLKYPRVLQTREEEGKYSSNTLEVGSNHSRGRSTIDSSSRKDSDNRYSVFRRTSTPAEGNIMAHANKEGYQQYKETANTVRRNLNMNLKTDARSGHVTMIEQSDEDEHSSSSSSGSIDSKGKGRTQTPITPKRSQPVVRETKAQFRQRLIEEHAQRQAQADAHSKALEEKQQAKADSKLAQRTAKKLALEEKKRVEQQAMEEFEARANAKALQLSQPETRLDGTSKSTKVVMDLVSDSDATESVDSSDNSDMDNNSTQRYDMGDDSNSDSDVDSDTHSLSDKLIKNRGPPPTSAAERAATKQRDESYNSIKTHWPHLEGKGYRDMQKALNKVYSQMAMKVMQGAKGTILPTPPMRQAATYIALYAPENTILPSAEIAVMQEEVLSTIMTIKYREPTSLHPKGHSVYFKEQWPQTTTKSAKKSVKQKSAEADADDEENTVTTLTTKGRMFYVGKKITPAQALAMSPEDRRYTMSILKGSFYIDASEAQYIPEGETQARRYITALINSQRYNDSMNNVKIVAPNSNDIAELVINDYQRGQEVCMVYHPNYDWSAAKIELAKKIIGMYLRALRLEGWTTVQRLDECVAIRKRIYQLSMTDYAQLANMTQKTLRMRVKTDPVLKEVRNIIDIIEGQCEKNNELLQTRQNWNGRAISEVKFPAHLLLVEEFREELHFGTYGDPELERFDFEKYRRLLKEVARTGRLITSVRKFRKDPPEKEYESTDSEEERQWDRENEDWWNGSGSNEGHNESKHDNDKGGDMDDQNDTTRDSGGESDQSEHVDNTATETKSVDAVDQLGLSKLDTILVRQIMAIDTNSQQYDSELVNKVRRIVDRLLEAMVTIRQHNSEQINDHAETTVCSIEEKVRAMEHQLAIKALIMRPEQQSQTISIGAPSSAKELRQAEKQQQREADKEARIKLETIKHVNIPALIPKQPTMTADELVQREQRKRELAEEEAKERAEIADTEKREWLKGALVEEFRGTHARAQIMKGQPTQRTIYGEREEYRRNNGGPGGNGDGDDHSSDSDSSRYSKSSERKTSASRSRSPRRHGGRSRGRKGRKHRRSNSRGSSSSRSRSISSNSSRDSRSRRSRCSSSRRSARGERRTHLYMWEKRPIPEGHERNYMEPTDLEAGIFNHRYDCTIRIGVKNQLLIDKMAPIPNVNLLNSRRVKNPEDSLTTEQLGRAHDFNGRGTIEFLEQVLGRMEEYCINPLAILTSLQEGKWMTKEAQNRWRGLALIEPDAVAFKRVSWSDPDRIEKAIIGLDDLIPRMITEFPDYSQVEVDPRKEIRALHLQTPTVVGLPVLLTELRMCHMKLPAGERTFESLERMFEEAIERNPNKDPRSVLTTYLMRKRALQGEMQIDLNDIQDTSAWQRDRDGTYYPQARYTEEQRRQHDARRTRDLSRLVEEMSRRAVQDREVAATELEFKPKQREHRDREQRDNREHRRDNRMKHQKDHRRDLFMREGKAIHVNKMEANIARHKKQIQLLIKDANVVSDEGEADTTFEMSDSDSDYAREHYMNDQWEEFREKQFQKSFDPTYHDIDGKTDSTGPTKDMIVAHFMSTERRQPSPEELQRAMRSQVPIEDRDHCTCCGYTGHLAETCSVSNVEGKIDKALLAGMQEGSATRRIYAAWTRGGQLTGFTTKEYQQFVTEVDAMRKANPGYSQQYNQPYTPRGPTRGGGGYQGHSGGRFGNNNPYGGGRGTSQRGPWQGGHSAGGHFSAGGQFRDNWSGPQGNNHDYYQTQAAQPQKPWLQPGYGPRELYEHKSQQSSVQQDPANKVITTTTANTTASATATTGTPTTVHMIQASKTAGARRVSAKSQKGTPIVRFVNADGQETETEGRTVKRARSGQAKNTNSGVKIVCNIMGVGDVDRKQMSPTVRPWKVEKPTNNLGLTYFKINVLHANDWDAAEELETIIKDPQVTRSPADVQFDNGAGHSVMSPEFAKQQGYKLHKRAVDGVVVGYNGEESRIEHFVIIGVEVTGTDIDGNAAKKVFVTQALVTPNLHVDFVLGSNVALEHNIYVIPDEGHATMFRGKDKLMVPCITWEEVQEGLKKKLKQRLINQNPLAMHTMIQKLASTTLPMSNDTFSKDETGSIDSESVISEESYSHVRGQRRVERVIDEQEAKALRKRMVREQEMDNDTDFMVRCTQLAQTYCNQGDDDIARTIESDMLDMVLADPTRYTRIHQDSKTHRFALAILVILARALRVRDEYFNLIDVMDTMDYLVFAGENTRDLIGTSQLVYELDIEENRRAISVLRLMVETMIYGHPDVQLEKIQLHTIEEAVKVFDETKTAEEEEWATSQRVRDEIDCKYATDSMHDMRPEEFPVELWRYVMDTQKPLVKARFARYSKERLAVVIAKIAKIDVSEESRARKAEAPYFKAQNLAHISSFEHPDPYNQPTVKGFEFKIEIEGDEPPAAARFQRFDPWETQFLHVKIKKMIAEKKMERSTSSWNARLALVPYIDRIQKFIAKHGDNTMTALYEAEHEDEVATFFRLTSDLRNVNLRTKAQIYPLPNISDLLSQCKGCDRYTSGDVCDAFFTIRMQEESRQYTAFSTPDGHYQYTVMPQGAKNAATYWAEMIATVFREMLSRQAPLIIYQDDVGNRGKDLLTHLRVQEEIYMTLERNEMIFKTTKMHCNYKMQRVLGHVLSGKGRVPDPKTLEAVRDLKEPTTLKEVRSILGLFQYAREYIENLSSIMDPIQQLTKKGVDIKATWDPKVHGVAFEALKLALTSAPILKIPDVSKPFKIQVDACRVGRGIGAILLQEDDEGTLRPCAYWSRALTDSERRYSATELEATALHDTILHWKVYLRNMLEFEAIVDHYALVYMVTRMGSEVQNQRLLRLCLDLQGFRFKVTHQSGVKHIGADAVSRLLRIGEEHYVRDEDELRDDWGPLSEKDKEKLNHDFGEDAKLLIETINAKREEKRIQDLEQQQIPTETQPIIKPIETTNVDDEETEQYIEQVNVLMMRLFGKTTEVDPERYRVKPIVGLQSQQYQPSDTKQHAFGQPVNIYDYHVDPEQPHMAHHSDNSDWREQEVKHVIEQSQRTVWRSNIAVCRQLRAHEDKLVAIQRERLRAQGEQSVEEIRISLKVQQDLEDMLRSQRRVQTKRAEQRQRHADQLREYRDIETAMSLGYGAPQEICDSEGQLWHYGRTASGESYKRPGPAPVIKSWTQKRNTVASDIGIIGSTAGHHDSWTEIMYAEELEKVAEKEKRLASLCDTAYSTWRNAGSPIDTTEFTDRQRRAQEEFQSFSRRIPRPLYRGNDNDTQYKGIETHVTMHSLHNRTHVTKSKQIGLLGKRLAQYATRSLQVAASSPLLVPEAKRQVTDELARRQQLTENRKIESTPTKVLWIQLEAIQKRLHNADNNHDDAKDRQLLEDIEAEFVNREIHKERKAYEARIAEANRGIAEAVEKIQQMKLSQSQKDAAKAGLEREQVRLDMDRAIDEMLQCEREGIPLTNTRLILAQQEYQRMTSLEKSQRTERICNHIHKSHQVVEDIHNRVRHMAQQIGRRATQVSVETVESDSEDHIDSGDDSDDINQIHVHMLDSRKQQLKAQSQREMTEMERVQRENQALASQKRAQDNALKVQAKKQQMTERLQKNTIARIKKMSQLETELKALKALEKKKSTDEFINEEIDRVIDSTIEDHGDFLISQMYICPETQVLYQVIDVVMEKELGNNRLVTIARPVDRDESGTLAQSEKQKREVHGINGTTELITRYEKGQRNFDDIPLPTNDDEWLAAQLSDEVCMKIIAKLGDIPNAILPLDGKSAADSEEYYYRALKEDRVTLSVLKKRSLKSKNMELRDTTVAIKREITQLVVPATMQDKILWIMHDQMGHPGRSRTIETIRLQYHWEGLYTQVTDYCRSCRYCNLRKANNRVAKVPIMVYNFAERPNSRVHFDTAGPFPLAKNGGHYILVLKDALTKWVTLIPVYSKDMYTVQKAYLEHWTSIYGAPDMLITDRGTEFHNRMAKQLAELWGVRKVATTSRNPRSDGQVENQMRTIKDMLQSYIQKNQLDWDEYLTLVAQAYNTTVNEATGMTPYYLMYGREMNLASEEHTETMEVADFHEMVQKVKEIQQWYWTYAGDRVVKNSERYNRVPAERLEYKPYSVGDFFYHRVVPKRAHKSEKEEKAAKISAKLQFRYVGPYMVDEVILPTVYKTTVHGKTRRVHALNMKPANTGRRRVKEIRDTPVIVEPQPTRRTRRAPTSTATDTQATRSMTTAR